MVAAAVALVAGLAVATSATWRQSGGLKSDSRSGPTNVVDSDTIVLANGQQIRLPRLPMSDRTEKRCSSSDPGATAAVPSVWFLHRDRSRHATRSLTVARNAKRAARRLRRACDSGEQGPADVAKHTDGDTLWLTRIGKVRLIGIDTAELYGRTECFGHLASEFVQRKLPPGSRVGYRLGVDRRDRYGRALAYVYLENGRLLNLLLVRRGFARPLTVPPNVEFAERFVAAARRARAAGRGLWAPGTCV